MKKILITILTLLLMATPIGCSAGALHQGYDKSGPALTIVQPNTVGQGYSTKTTIEIEIPKEEK